ncbi:MAG TPA: hypothetical protein PLC97_00595 [Myxococcota bacterium]|jgi:hypothetical protein|nr:hypothetical protein [Myxococcota bacterium]HQL58071.1 hypothetical protein [Myxococcota bacterium]
MYQDSKLIKSTGLLVAAVFCSLALVWTTGCGSDDAAKGAEVTETMCNKLKTCSKLDVWGYESLDQCTEDIQGVWNKYKKCHDEIEAVVKCVSGVACEEAEPEKLAVPCGAKYNALMTCIEEVDAEPDEQEPDPRLNDMMEDMCDRIVDCSKLDVWDYADRKQCMRDSMWYWSQYGQCIDSLEAAANCALGLECEQIEPQLIGEQCPQWQAVEDCVAGGDENPDEQEPDPRLNAMMEAMCDKIVDCSKLDVWDYADREQCMRDSMGYWSQYGQCIDPLAATADCVLDLECEYVEPHLIGEQCPQWEAVEDCVAKVDENPREPDPDRPGDFEVAEALCHKLYGCSKLDTWSFESLEHCIDDSLQQWTQYELCRREMVAVGECAVGVPCEEIDPEQLVTHCGEQWDIFSRCMEKVDEDRNR